MIATLIGIVLTLLIVGIIYWAIQQLLPLIPLPEPFRKIIDVLLVVILVLVVLYIIIQLLGALGGAYVPNWLRL
jgi:hypothetical protein